MESLETYINQIVELAVAYAPKVLLAIVAWLIGSWIVKQLVKMLDKAMKRSGIDETTRPFLRSLSSLLLKLLLVLTVVAIVGVEITAFAAVLAAMAFAVGMALQGSLSNFAGGVLLLIFKPFRVGDLITAMGYNGHVEEIQAFSTTLVTLDHRTIVLPNGALASSPIENISRKGVIRVDIPCGIAYQDDIDKARTVIQGVIDECPYVVKERTHDIFVSELGDSSVNFVVRIWVKSADYWDSFFYMPEHIKKAFDREGVNIPYPTMDVNLLKQN